MEVPYGWHLIPRIELIERKFDWKEIRIFFQKNQSDKTHQNYLTKPRMSFIKDSFLNFSYFVGIVLGLTKSTKLTISH